MDESGRLGGEDLLGLVKLSALEIGKLVDLLEGEFGEQLEEALDIAILAVPPILPVVVGGEHVGVEPHRAGGGLPHLGARWRGEKRGGEPEQLRPVGAAPEFDAAHDVAPLVRSAELQAAGVAPVKFDEVVSLQHHVVELDET